MINYLKNNIQRCAVYILLFIFIFGIVYFIVSSQFSKPYMQINMMQNQSGIVKVYYLEDKMEKAYDEEHTVSISIEQNENFKNIKIILEDENLKNIRIDFNDNPDEIYKINNIYFKNSKQEINFTALELENMIDNGQVVVNQMKIASINKQSLTFVSEGSDPYMIFENFSMKPYYPIVQIVSTLAIALIMTWLLHQFVHLRDIMQLIINVIKERKLITSLSLNDFKIKYAGSYFGIIWAFVQPLCTILVFWFVFQIGLRSQPVMNVPFILWMICGLVPWFFFSDAWNSATNAFSEYSYLVKKVIFNIDILPLVKIISALFVHLVFVGITFIILILYHIPLNVQVIGVFYYMFCMCVLVVGLSFITSSVVIFFKDLTQVMNIILQFGMWLTPIMWNVSIIPSRFIWLFKLNPMYYIVNGYRSCLIGNNVAQTSMTDTAYFWLVTIFLFFIGLSLFRRLRPHFADVL